MAATSRIGPKDRLRLAGRRNSISAQPARLPFDYSHYASVLCLLIHWSLLSFPLTIIDLLNTH